MLNLPESVPQLYPLFQRDRRVNLDLNRVLVQFYNRPKMYIKKQPSIGVLIKSCSKNIQQIYRTTPMPKCDFNKVAKQLFGILTKTWNEPKRPETSENELK